MRKEDLRALIVREAEQRGLTVEGPEQIPLPEEDRRNRAFVVGSRILVGEFDREEDEVLAIAHEVGHTTLHEAVRPDLGPGFTEACAWREGLDLLAAFGVTPSPQGREFIRKSLSTYFGDGPERTRMCWWRPCALIAECGW